jgi:anti-sigma-K factor RskA
MGGLKLPRFAAAAAATLLVACAAALVPALVLPGAAGPALSVVLLALLGCSLTVPNVLVHVARRLTVHHCGASRVVHYNVTTGEADLRRRICAAFAGCAAIEPAAIEGLEHPRSSGVVYHTRCRSSPQRSTRCSVRTASWRCCGRSPARRGSGGRTCSPRVTTSRRQSSSGSSSGRTSRSA